MTKSYFEIKNKLKQIGNFFVKVDEIIISFASKLPIIVITFVIICVLGFLNFCKMPTTEISFDVQSDNVIMDLTKNWECQESFPSDTLFVNNVAKIDCPGLTLPNNINPLQNTITMYIKDADLTVQDITLKKGAEVEFNTHGNNLKWYVKKSPLSGKIFLTKGTVHLEIVGVGSKEIKIDQDWPPGEISFQTLALDEQSSEFRITPKEDWFVYKMAVSDIGFYEMYPPDSSFIRSTIHSGNLNVSQSDINQTLHRGDFIKLDDVKRIRHLEISKNKNNMQVYFEGDAASIAFGPFGYERNLSLNRVEYWYYRVKSSAFFGALVGVLGLILYIILEIAGGKKIHRENL